MNLLSKIFMKIRMGRAIRKWNADEAWIESQIKKDNDPNASFNWKQLVWQEIWMWILIGDKTAPRREMEFLAKRRGFNKAQREYLESMMRHVWLWAEAVPSPPRFPPPPPRKQSVCSL